MADIIYTGQMKQTRPLRWIISGKLSLYHSATWSNIQACTITPKSNQCMSWYPTRDIYQMCALAAVTCIQLPLF